MAPRRDLTPEPNRPNSYVSGQVAERFAADHLRRLGYQILETNVRVPGGELDIVAEQKGTLVFVEVRARRGSQFGTAVETVGFSKRRRVAQAAQGYLQVRAVDPARPSRIDVVAIQLDRTGRPTGVDVITNAFGLE